MSGIMSMFHTFVRRSSTLGGCLAAVILIALIGHMVLEMVLRSFFSRSTYVLDEFVGYGVAAMTFLAAAYTLRSGSFIRVSILLDRLDANGAVRRSIELVCVAMTAVVTTLITVYMGLSAFRHFSRGTVSDTISEIPMWMPEGLVFAGLVILELELVSYALRITAGAPLVKESEDAVD